ncbi:MAG: magnesium protoporphyrin IX methyltransferase, partial [Chloroflexota bacterium]
WSAIYGGGPVSRVRRAVRTGHEKMLTEATTWLTATHPTPGTLLDAGCGTGLFTVEMASRGYQVTATDIAPRMVTATRTAADEANVGDNVQTITSDLSTVSGAYDAVACFDVLVHYSSDDFAPLLAHLAERANHTLLFTFAPYNRLLAALHWIGGHFPKGERRTEIQMIRDDLVIKTLANAGMSISHRVSISHGVYHVELIAATRQHNASN